jgi:hypothetical protein
VTISATVHDYGSGVSRVELARPSLTVGHYGKGPVFHQVHGTDTWKTQLAIPR